ncbi:hypothetical protein BWD14_06380 [Leptospira santarosai]|uniref:Uncharacterized protein n=1 Tax=Leptospira santarosai TaxID=28183 RepID=A0AB73MRG0_9LEPT|nr:hypothetical protein BWD14_06380 [Leptospira santarosai]
MRYSAREYQSNQSSRMLFSSMLNYLMINMRKKIYCSSWVPYQASSQNLHDLYVVSSFDTQSLEQFLKWN